MSKGYRKLRVLLNTKHPRLSRIVDAETGEDILISDMQIELGYNTKFELRVHFTMSDPGIEIMIDEPLEVPEQPQ